MSTNPVQRCQPMGESGLDVTDQVKVMAWNAVVQKNEEIASLKARIEELETALRFIAAGYANLDVNHVDFRVKTYEVALDVLNPKGAT